MAVAARKPTVQFRPLDAAVRDFVANRQLTTLRDRARQLKRELAAIDPSADLREKLAAERSRLGDLQARLAERQAAMLMLREQQEAEAAVYKAQTEAKYRTFRGELEALRAKNAGALESFRKEASGELSELREEVAALAAQLQRRREEHTAEVARQRARRKERLTTMAQELHVRAVQYCREMEATVAQAERDAEAKLRSELSDLQAVELRVLEMMERQHGQALSQARAHYEAASKPRDLAFEALTEYKAEAQRTCRQDEERLRKLREAAYAKEDALATLKDTAAGLGRDLAAAEQRRLELEHTRAAVLVAEDRVRRALWANHVMEVHLRRCEEERGELEKSFLEALATVERARQSMEGEVKAKAAALGVALPTSEEDGKDGGREGETGAAAAPSQRPPDVEDDQQHRATLVGEEEEEAAPDDTREEGDTWKRDRDGDEEEEEAVEEGDMGQDVREGEDDREEDLEAEADYSADDESG